MTSPRPIPRDESPRTALRADEQHRATFEATLGQRFWEGNQVDVLRNGVQIFPPMLEAIEEADRTIDFLSYIYWTGGIAQRFARALCEASRRGVEVRVLLDGFGAAKMRRTVVHEMRNAGIELAYFRPPRTWRLWRLSHRTHRKVMICDDRVAFTGGAGIAEEWEGDARDPSQWRDTHFRIRGPAVAGLTAAFEGNWLEIDRTPRIRGVPPLASPGTTSIQVIRGAASIGWSDVATIYHVAFRTAATELDIQTPYFSPDEDLMHLLADVAGRGVCVRLLLPGQHMDVPLSRWAAQARFEHLLDRGVEIYAYQPTMMHTKVMVIDRSVACVGSQNLNQRSLRKDEEIALVLDDEVVARELRSQFEDDLQHCERIDPGSFRRRPRRARFLERAATLLDAEL